MIANEREYGITKRSVEEFEAALADIDATAGTRDSLHQQALHDSIAGIIEERRELMAEYEARCWNSAMPVESASALEIVPPA